MFENGSEPGVPAGMLNRLQIPLLKDSKNAFCSTKGHSNSLKHLVIDNHFISLQLVLLDNY